MKVGKFQENYGWAFADHTTFVRTGLWQGYDGSISHPPTPPSYGIGAQIGLRPKSFDITASYTDNADAVNPGPQDTQKRWYARVLAQQGIESLGLQFSAGGSWFDSPSYSNPRFTQNFFQQQAWGGFGGIGWQGITMKGYENGYGFLTTALLFEYDRKAWTPDPFTPSPPVTSAYSTTQLMVMVKPGCWLIGEYDWLDNNTESKDPLTGSSAERKSFGLQIFPLPWIDITPMYRVYVPSTSQGHMRNVQHGELQVHMLF